MRHLAIFAIGLYKRCISPYKGFCCAFKVHTGRQSCSTLGIRVIRRYGLRTGIAVLRRRLYLCGVAHRRYSLPYPRPHRSQRGDCDPGFDLPCHFDLDLPSGRSCSKLGDFLSCCDCSCDWPRRRKGTSKEQSIYIPPKINASNCSK